MSLQELELGLRLDTARVLVVGDVMLDRYWSGATGRISPEAPVQVVNIDKDDLRPGGAANVAVNVASLGASVRLLGVVGNDDAARLLTNSVAAFGVQADFVVSSNCPTITKLRVVSRNQQLMRLDFESSLGSEGCFDRGGLYAKFIDALATVDAVILSDYGKGTLSSIEDMIAEARRQCKPVIVDPKGVDYSRYSGATLITPNMAEFEAVVGHCADEGEIVAKGLVLREKLGLDALLVTRSEHGMTLLRQNEPPLHLPTEAREVFDVTGAGDTVIATLGTALASGKDLELSCRLGNMAAGIVVAKFGTSAITTIELEHVLYGVGGVEQPIMAEDALLARVTAAKENGKRVVFTNGCFDILHVGHTRYLEAARRLGDLLVVAVNTDASVKRLKGNARPINGCADRMHVLAALKSVDWVVEFDEDTPERIIRKLIPDVLVKGGDYPVEEIVGYEVVTEAGGEVIALDFHEGYSTTRIIDRTNIKFRME
ncbi:heptose 1-phosphate adenyltransferase [Duganella sp. Leaf126]|uniref:bifunctional D-glycero-beta-D-manno-heptose-7-phosphate kinase/D-glycero-beta-D-manno-heptose 1-phosphate adenylyltransferase HldE n=1 Tax=Duganella sp. Leaf126 TaxID=1736266 RepID=UPI0006FAE7AC|nr:bifunctional D-glycero-beta-D-manno-heptose-7-phosphate kinase/D-glycero-beta-D-manno-heptose 1-phosphate adenylyltransferase HldE [Duganella sp. Leaf126]KQQ33583.1 heptose 1-phosphate adenyltransferase [Duganella sp. Leaf126]